MTGWGLLLEGQVAVYKYWSRDSMTGGGGDCTVYRFPLFLPAFTLVYIYNSQCRLLCRSLMPKILESDRRRRGYNTQLVNQASREP